MGGVIGYNFGNRYPKDDSGQVWFIQAQSFQKRRFLKKLMDDGRKVMAKAHPGLRPGELKNKRLSKSLNRSPGLWQAITSWQPCRILDPDQRHNSER